MQDINRDLISAVREGDINVVKLLLQHGAKVDNEDEDCKTVLYHAVSSGCLKIVEEVLKYFPDINNESNRSSLEIAICGHIEEYKKISEALLDYGFIFNPENAYNPKFVHGAVEKGFLTIIEDLFKYGADVNMLCKGLTPLHTAAKYRLEQVAKLLISYEADINARDEYGKTPIFYAIENGDSKITKLLLTNGANIKNCPELLNTAVENDYECLEIVEALLQHDADVNASDEYGLTALHFTAVVYVYGDIDNRGKIAKLLLNKGANANAQDEIGTTTLHLCAKYGVQNVINTLFKFGADVNSRDKHSRTALHLACEKEHLEIVETLLRYGADINITDTYNDTALDDVIESSNTHPLIRHIIQMKAANLYVNERNLLSLHRYDAIDLDKFEEECVKEIVSMKSENINNTRISFHDILTKDTISVEIFMSNENIVQVLKSDDYKAKFPKYASMIECNLRKAMERKKLLQQSYKIFHFLINNLPELPFECTDKIFSYLSNKDLQIFNDAGRNANELI